MEAATDSTYPASDIKQIVRMMLLKAALIYDTDFIVEVEDRLRLLHLSHISSKSRERVSSSALLITSCLSSSMISRDTLSGGKIMRKEH